MSDIKREIIFNESMTLDKRAAEFAYLRKNCFSAFSKGLYPSAGFTAPGVTIPTGFVVRYLETDVTDEFGDIVEGRVIIEDPTNDIVRVLETTSGDQVGSDITNAIFKAASNDGDGNLHIAVEEGGVEKLYICYATSSMPLDGNWTTSAMSAYLGKFDGLNHYWTEGNTGSDIYRSSPQSNTNTLVFNNCGFRPIEADFYGDQMVLFGQDGYRKDIYIVFWDKTSSTLFDKRIIEKNARFIAGGVVDGRLMLIKAIGNSTNLKEAGGKLVITVYDGEKFVEINSIRIGSSDTQRGGFRNHQAIGNGVLVFGVTNNEDSQNDDLYKNYLFKVYADGKIETLWQSDGDSPFVAAVGYDEIAFVGSNLDFSSSYSLLTQNVLSNKDTTNAYADYENFDESVYITNFLNNAYNLHKLDAFAVAFEKLYEQTDESAVPPTGEELDVYYRVSERDDWTLLMNVTVEKVEQNVNQNRDQSTEYASDTQGLPEQRYMVTVLPNGSPLPEYNEIQFRFVSKRGFTVIGAWYSYSYLSRNTLA